MDRRENEKDMICENATREKARVRIVSSVDMSEILISADTSPPTH